MTIATLLNSAPCRTLVALATMLGATALPAIAGGDVVNGPILRQTIPAAVPVPAPVPVPDVASGYYLRVDAAYGFNNVDRYVGSDVNTNQVRADDGLSNFARFGLGAGYHFSRWVRGDLTLDARTEVKSNAAGFVNYAGPNDLDGRAIRLRDSVADAFRTTAYTGLFNGYLDLPVTETITPYVGAGVGWVLHAGQTRTTSKITTCVDTLNCNPGAQAGGLNYGPAFGNLNSSTSGKGPKLNDVQLATALMAGVAFNVSQNGKIDLGWRWLHLDGTTFQTAMSNGIPSKITIPDQDVQEIRIGYRYEIN